MNSIKKIKNNISYAAALSGAALLLPAFAGAAPTDFKSLVAIVLDVINSLVQLVMVLALLFFVWNIFKLVFSGGSETDKTEAKNYMIIGIIALFVMVSVWGLVNILTSSLFGGSFVVPQLK